MQSSTLWCCPSSQIIFRSGSSSKQHMAAPEHMAQQLLRIILVAMVFLTVMGSVPLDLSNFQNNYVCDNRTLIVRPHTIQDVQDAVRYHAKVKAVGEGHSWNQPFFCADANGPAPDETSANIVVTTIRPLHITVDEANETVQVDAGVKTIDLLEYLANYVTEKAPAGWTLPAFPWFVYQSIGGAVATGTHGSSLPWKSLSNQLLEITMVLANGTLHTFSEQDDPFLFRAAKVSVGKLGIVTSLKLRIVRERPVQRTLRSLPASVFLQLLSEAQEQYKADQTFPDWLNETEFFWITQRSEFMMVSYLRDDVPDPALSHSVLQNYQPESDTIFNTTQALMQNGSIISSDQLPLLDNVTFLPDGLTPDAQAYLVNKTWQDIDAPVPAAAMQPIISFNGPADLPRKIGAGSKINPVAWGSSWSIPQPRTPLSFYAFSDMATGYLDISRSGVLSIAYNATLEAHLSYLYQPRAILQNIQQVPYDQYEVSVPITSMADCFSGLLERMYDGDIDSTNDTQAASDKGFRTAPLVRFLGQEDGLLALNGDAPRMFVNIEDYIYYNAGGRTNEKFKEVMAYFTSSPTCGQNNLNGTGARLHWGKAGWPDPGCFHGDISFPDTWCDFGCAVQQLDPEGKFMDSASDRWTWRGVDLQQCCGPQGFLAGQQGCTCKVQHGKSVDQCPPAPYYTYR